MECYVVYFGRYLLAFQKFFFVVIIRARVFDDLVTSETFTREKPTKQLTSKTVVLAWKRDNEKRMNTL